MRLPPIPFLPRQGRSRARLEAASVRAAAAGLLAVSLASTSCRTGQPAESARTLGDVDDPQADAAMTEGRWHDAVRLHLAVLDRDPGNGPAMYHLGYSEGSLNRRREEVRWYERAAEAGYRRPDLLYNLGLARLALNDLEDAESALAEAAAQARARAR